MSLTNSEWSAEKSHQFDSWKLGSGFAFFGKRQDLTLCFPLGGAGDRINIVPQASTLNRGDWKAMENEFRAELNRGKTVSIKIEVGYPPGGGVNAIKLAKISL